MSSRFLGTQNAEGITDGTLNIKGATLAADNLATGKPVRANAAKQIISTDLLISDVQGLQAALDNPVFVDVNLSGNILPVTDNSSDIGQPLKKFKNGYFTQITPTTVNGPVSISGGDLNMSIRKITNLATPTSSADATTKTYVDTADNLKLSLAGGTLTGQVLTRDVFPATTNLYALGTSSFKYADVQTANATIENATLTTGTISTTAAAATDIANKTYVDTQRDTRLALSGGTLTGNVLTNTLLPAITNTYNLGTVFFKYKNLELTGNINALSGAFTSVTATQAAAGANDLTNKTYVDNADSTRLALTGGQLNGDVTTRSLTPVVTNFYSLGNPTFKWAAFHSTNAQIDNLLLLAPMNGTKATFTSDVTAKASYMESWWAHNLLQTTAMVTNVATTSIRINTETSFYFSPSLATAGRLSMIPVVLTSTPTAVTPVFARDGPNSITEWVQTLVPIAANPAGPSTTGGNRVQYTYSGPAARRFSVTITGTYQTLSGATFIVFQGLIRFVSGVPNIINGTASSWFESDANRVFIGVSKKILLVNPGDVFEVAVGYDPLNAPNQLNNITARDMTIAFVSMLNNS